MPISLQISAHPLGRPCKWSRKSLHEGGSTLGRKLSVNSLLLRPNASTIGINLWNTVRVRYRAKVCDGCGSHLFGRRTRSRKRGPRSGCLKLGWSRPFRFLSRWRLGGKRLGRSEVSNLVTKSEPHRILKSASADRGLWKFSNMASCW